MFTPFASFLSSCCGGKSSVSRPVKDRDTRLERVCSHDPTLLQQSCDEFIRTRKGSEEAVRAGNKIDLMLRHTDNPNISKGPLFNALSQAIIHNRPWMFKKLLSHPKIDINHRPEIGEPPLHHAIRKGNYSVFRELMRRKAEVSASTARLASLCGRPHMLEKILDQLSGEEFVKVPHEDLRHQAYLQARQIFFLKDVPERAEELLKEKLLDETDPEECLSGVAETLRAGANVNGRDEAGDTPLHLAAGRDEETPFHLTAGGDLEALMGFLLHEGAEPSSRNHEGETPLHPAVGRDLEAELIEFLLQEGADPNSRNHEGDTPLHRAAKRNSAALKLLLKAGVNPNVANQHGITPLHRAACGRHVENTRALLEAGANPRAIDSSERTPMDLFGLHGYAADKTVLNMLEEAARQAEHRLPVDIPSSSSAGGSSRP